MRVHGPDFGGLSSGSVAEGSQLWLALACKPLVVELPAPSLPNLNKNMAIALSQAHVLDITCQLCSFRTHPCFCH